MSDEAAEVAEQEESTPSTEESEALETEEVESEEESEASGEEPAEDAKGVQKRINTLTWQRHEAERRASELQQRLEQLERQSRAPEKAAGPAAPNPLDFEDQAEFQKAQNEYTRAVARQIAEEARAEEAATRQQRERDEARQKYSAVIAAHAAEDADFVELVRSADFSMPDAMTECLVTTTRPVEMTRYLAEHAAEAVRISQLSPIQQAREMGRLEARLEALQPKRVSDAPPAMKRPKGNERVRTDPDSMSVEEWKAWREKQLAKKK